MKDFESTAACIFHVTSPFREAPQTSVGVSSTHTSSERAIGWAAREGKVLRLF
jgi:hypothetical protein